MPASNAQTSAGSFLSVSAGLPATHDTVGFEDAAMSFTEVGEITDLGEFGREYNLVTHNPLKDRRTVKRKGSYNDGSITLQMARDVSEAGQALLETAKDDDNSYSVKITFQDGNFVFTTAQIMSYKTTIGSVDQITMATCVLEIDNDIVAGTPV
jgi:hypothetical protein